MAVESRSNAAKVFKKIQDKTSRLYHSPERGRIVPELKDFGIVQFRELVIPPWRIMYRVSENRVYVLSVIDSCQNVEDILLKRLTSHNK